MQSTIDYRTTRALQICIVFISTLLIQRLLNFSHAGWIGFAVMMIYAGFDSGSSLHRTMHRFWGAMLGLFLTYILFFFIRFDDDLIYVVIPIIIFMAYFSLSKYYVAPTIFTVTLTGLGSDYYQSNLYAIDQFFFDYTKATVLALSICVFFEYFIFKKKNLTHKFYFDLQKALVLELQALFDVVTARPLRRSHYLKLSAQLDKNAMQLQTFLKMASHDYHLRADVFDKLEIFQAEVDAVYQHIRRLFVLRDTSVDVLSKETQDMLQQLDVTVRGGVQSEGD